MVVCLGLTLIRTLRWRHNGRDSVSTHQTHHCLLNRLFRRRSKKTSKLRVTGLCVGNSPGTGEFPAQMASNTENVSIWKGGGTSGFASWFIGFLVCLITPFLIEKLRRGHLNTSSPGQNGRHFTDDIFRCIFLNEKFCILIKISLKFVPKGLIINNPALVWIMA